MKIIDDPRKINMLCTEHLTLEVGYGGVLEITPYEENGQLAPVTWFSVHHEDGRTEKYNSHYVRKVVYYGESKK